MIDVENLVYDYPSGRALHGLGFVVRQGAVLALVGPNGAGKSTLMRCISALDPPTEGQVTVLGLDTRTHPREVHAALGYLPDVFGLYEALSVRRALTYAARSKGVEPRHVEAAVAQAAAHVGLSDRMEALAGTLSRGLRQRLAIAQTIVHRPRVLLLDEPASGLDPEARHELSGLIRSLAGEAMTIVVSSHILAELEDYCTEMLMLSEGRVVGDGVVRAGAPLWSEAAAVRPGVAGAGASRVSANGAVMSEPAASTAAVRIEVAFAEPVADLAARLTALGYAAERVGPAEALIVLAPGPGAESQALESAALARLVGAGLPVSGFSPVRATLEQTYLAAAAQAKAATAVPQTTPEPGEEAGSAGAPGRRWGWRR